jgi:uncharacterized protein DUF6622
VIIDILRHTPLWVWVLLSVVVGLGFLQTRDREVSRARAVTLPLIFIALSLSAFFRGPSAGVLPLAGWASGFASAWTVGYRLVAVRGAEWLPDSSRIHVPGSWVPLTLMVGLFLLKYSVGVASALAPALRMQPMFLLTINLAYGVFAGAFWARSRSLLALVRQGQTQRRLAI